MRLLKLFLSVLAIFAISCGDSNSNDNGVSFTFFGWFEDVAGEVGVTSAIYALNGSGINNNNIILYGGLQNNMTEQFVIVKRAYMSYAVPGSSIRIPNTSVGVSSFARPAIEGDATSTGAGNSTLPPAASSDEGATYAGTILIPASIGEYISLNRNQLPRPPFQMVITTHYEGTTSAGYNIKSNPIELTIQVVSDLIIGGGEVAPEEEVDPTLE